MMIAKSICLVPLFLLLCPHNLLAFKDGEFIQTARKSQFHQSRTHWHDLLGHHCPRFGRSRVVAVPLPKPTLPLLSTDEFKIQFSFNGDRYVTPWFQIMGKGAPEVPFLDVELRRSGDELLGVQAKIRVVPESYKQSHSKLVQEYKNTTHWPKHLIVHYKWKTENPVDLNRGLYFVFAIGLPMLLYYIVSAAWGVRAKLAILLKEMVAEETSIAPSTSTWKEGVKAE